MHHDMAQDMSFDMSWAFVIYPTHLCYPALSRHCHCTVVVVHGWLVSASSPVVSV